MTLIIFSLIAVILILLFWEFFWTFGNGYSKGKGYSLICNNYITDITITPETPIWRHDDCLNYKIDTAGRAYVSLKLDDKEYKIRLLEDEEVDCWDYAVDSNAIFALLHKQKTSGGRLLKIILPQSSEPVNKIKIIELINMNLMTTQRFVITKIYAVSRCGNYLLLNRGDQELLKANSVTVFYSYQPWLYDVDKNHFEKIFPPSSATTPFLHGHFNWIEKRRHGNVMNSSSPTLNPSNDKSDPADMKLIPAIKHLCLKRENEVLKIPLQETEEISALGTAYDKNIAFVLLEKQKIEEWRLLKIALPLKNEPINEYKITELFNSEKLHIAPLELSNTSPHDSLDNKT